MVRLSLTAALLAIFVKPLGLTGAALATVLAIALTKVLTLRKLRALFKVPASRLVPWSRLGKIAAISLAAGAVAWVGPAAAGARGIPARLSLSGLLLLTVYVALIWPSDILEPQGKRSVIRLGQKLAAGLFPSGGGGSPAP